MMIRKSKELLNAGLNVIDAAHRRGAYSLAPLFSGGHDSLCACFIASQHPRFDGVYHIDTGIGAKQTRKFVEELCHELDWKLNVYKSPFTYEMFVRKYGFPGPGNHQWIYNRLKDRCICQITKARRRPVALITGCRQQESLRRMGHVEPVKVGETSKKTGITRLFKRIWTAPCFDWSKEEQLQFMEDHDLPHNPIKETIIGMSGECFCGAFARPNEIAMLRHFTPDVAEEIDRLSIIAAKQKRKNCIWGKKMKGVIVAETGPLCSSCDIRATNAGIILKE
jgi:3'-phosphoadenosine 5'-phosphosulfate sulfotransferase (PAPS reductase)/FAD synthetase